MKITKKIINRPITLDEFIKQKSSPEFANMRQTAKSLNFLLIFGGSAKVFSEESLELSWTPEQIEEYIEHNHCERELEEVRNKYWYSPENQQRYLAVATRLRDNFFKGYPGLMDRIERERDFARNHGYVRSPFGATRKTIELYLEGEYDKKAYSKMMRNLENICANTSIQNMEASVAKRVMYEMQNWIKEHKLKSWIWNEIHDSIDLFLHKTEVVPVLWKLKKLAEQIVPEFSYSPIILKVDCEISDLNNGDYYKGGRDVDDFLPEGLNWEDLDKLTEEEAFSYAA